MKKKRTAVTIVYGVCLLTFFVSLCVFTGKAVAARDLAGHTLRILQCLIGMMLLHIPPVLGKLLKTRLPALLTCLYFFFIFGALFLGEICSFYYLLRYWDVFLHGFSSLMCASFAFILIFQLVREKIDPLSLSPFTLCLFAFSFSLAVGTLWEIFEYTFDGILGLNMQKFRLADGTILTGHDALRDTMKDLIVDTAGSLIAALIGYFSLRLKKGWVYELYTRQS